MPLTIAHPAAVIPLGRWLGNWAIPSALVIGSVAPDLAYVLPIGVSRTASHSIEGLLWFCLPVGYGAYLLFHVVLKAPLLSLLPTDVSRRLDAAGGSHRVPAAPWLAVPTSLLLGALTHVFWDAFTHDGAPAVRAIELLRVQLFTVGPYPVFVYKILQHGSTLIGVLVLSWWTLRWLRRAAPGPEPTTPLEPWGRLVAMVFLLGIPAGCGVASAVSNLSSHVTGATLQVAAGRAVLSSFSAFAVVLLAFGLWWHVWFGRRETRT